MLAATYGTVSDIEILWTIIGAVGVMFSAFNLRDARIDKRVLADAGIVNGRRIIARFAVRAELARLVIQAIFVTIGVLAMLQTDPPNAALNKLQIVTSAVSRVGLVIAELLVLFKSIDGYMTRKLLQGD